EDGYQYLWAGGKLLGWGMAIVGSAGAGAVVGGTTAAGTVTVGSVASYLGTQAAISAGETGVEWAMSGLTGSQFNPYASFGKNIWLNPATGGIGGTVKYGGKFGAYALRQGIETVGDTAIDVGVYGNDLGYSLATNLAGNIIGEQIGRR